MCALGQQRPTVKKSSGKDTASRDTWQSPGRDYACDQGDVHSSYKAILLSPSEWWVAWSMAEYGILKIAVVSMGLRGLG